MYLTIFIEKELAKELEEKKDEQEETEEQDIDESEKREDRGERPTPEEEALDRLLNRH